MSQKYKNSKKNVPQKHQDSQDLYKFENTKKQQNKSNIKSVEEILDPSEADQLEYLALLPEDFPIDENDAIAGGDSMIIARKIVSDLKNLMIKQFREFWATIKHNIFLQDSLDLFLRYSPRDHLIGYQTVSRPGTSEDYENLVQEIYKLILWVYIRMVSFKEEDQGGILFQSFGCKNILYDHWLIDIIKLTEIAQIYGKCNQNLVKRIIEGSFSIQQAYYDDFKSTYKRMDALLTDQYTTLAQFTNQSVSDTSDNVFVEDLRQKMEILTQVLDALETLDTWVEYFPDRCRSSLLNNLSSVVIVEQIFYEVLYIKGFTRGKEIFKSHWKLERFYEGYNNLSLILQRILTKALKFFRNYFEHVTKICLQLIDTHDRSKVSSLTDHMNYIIKQMGLVRRRVNPKKKQNVNEIKEWHLAEGLWDLGFSIPEFLGTLVPYEFLNQIDKGEKDELCILLLSVLEDRKKLKEQQFGVFQEVQQELKLEDIEQFDVERSQLQSLEDQFKKQTEDNKEEEVEQSKQITKEEVLVPIVSKRNQKLSLDLPYEQRKELAEMMAKLYDDEPDDTYDYDAPKKIQSESEESENEVSKQKVVVKNKSYHHSQDYMETQSQPSFDQNPRFQQSEKSYYQQKSNNNETKSSYNLDLRQDPRYQQDQYEPANEKDNKSQVIRSDTNLEPRYDNRQPAKQNRDYNDYSDDDEYGRSNQGPQNNQNRTRAQDNDKYFEKGNSKYNTNQNQGTKTDYNSNYQNNKANEWRRGDKVQDDRNTQKFKEQNYDNKDPKYNTQNQRYPPKDSNNQYRAKDQYENEYKRKDDDGLQDNKGQTRGKGEDNRQKKIIQREPERTVNRDGGYQQNVYKNKNKDDNIFNKKYEEKDQSSEQISSNASKSSYIDKSTIKEQIKNQEFEEMDVQPINPQNSQSSNQPQRKKYQTNKHDQGKGYRNKNTYYNQN